MSYEENERAIARMWRVNRTVHQMVADRGYLVSHNELNLSLDDFRQTKCSNGSVLKKEMQFMVEHGTTRQGLLVSFLVDESVGIKPIRNVIEDMINHKVERGIVVYPKTMTPSANKGLAEVQGTLTVETFTEAELLVNITKHVLVPLHQVMSDEEKKTLLERYRLKESQLPRIHPTDPVARYYGMKRGQVVRIIRKSETAGQYVTYRFCF